MRRLLLSSYQKVLAALRNNDEHTQRLLNKMTTTYVETMHRMLDECAKSEQQLPHLFYLQGLLKEAADTPERRQLTENVLHRMYAYHAKDLADRIRQYIPKEGRGLDIGGRDGGMANVLRRDYKINIISTDKDPHKNPYIHLEKPVFHLNACTFESREDFVVEKNSQDFVTMCNLLHKISVDQQYMPLGHARNVLKDNGKLIIASPAVDDPEMYAFACAADGGEESKNGGIQSSRGILESLQDAGWDIATDEIIFRGRTDKISSIDGFHHYIIEVIKNSDGGSGVHGKQHLIREAKEYVAKWQLEAKKKGGRVEKRV